MAEDAAETGSVSAAATLSVPKTEPAGSSPAAPAKAPYESCDCLRCGHHWKARNPQARPSSCPRCGSGLWDRPPIRRTARRPDDPPNPNWKYRHKPIKRKCPTCHRPWTRLTVKERQELEIKRDVTKEMAGGPPAPVELPKVVPNVHMPPGAVVAVPRKMTPPPGMHSPPTPPPLRRAQAPETPEVQASRRSLSDELKENS